MIVTSNDLHSIWSAILDEKARSAHRNVVILTSIAEVDSACSAAILHVSACVRRVARVPGLAALAAMLTAALDGACARDGMRAASFGSAQLVVGARRHP
jgi:hypothetical protein